MVYSSLKWMPVICLFAAVAGCKKNAANGDQSTAASLDNFASTEFSFNDCSRPDAKPVSFPAGSIHAGPYQEVVARALSTVPPSLRDAFFAPPIHGRIALVDSVLSACGSGPLARDDPQKIDDQSLSCLKSTGDSGPVTIYIKREKTAESTVRNINHSLVRSFGYVLSGIIADNLPGSESIHEIASEFSIRLLLDVAQYKGDKGYDLTMFSEFLPRAVLAKGLDEMGRRQAFAGLEAEQKQRFQEAVLAEVFDSLICSQQSRATLIRDFKRVAGDRALLDKADAGSSLADYLKVMTAEDALRQIMDGLGDAVSKTEGYDASAAIQGGESGFSLWGRWGAGNGPLRQGVSNWANHRASGNGLFNARRFASGGGFVFRKPWLNPFRWGSQ